MSVVEIRVCGRYKLTKRINISMFSSIYLAKNVQTNNDVVVKMEEIKSKYPQLLYEGKIIQNLQGGIGIPNMHWCGQEGDFNFLVMEQLGQNLEQLFNLCNRKFSLKTVLMLAVQLISNIEYVHYKAYIHRDIKPENFIFGVSKKLSTLYTIDFSLSKRYKDQRTHEHIQFRERKPLIGTARYVSINAHRGYELSRRDDIESIGYILIYFLKGSLPWQGISLQNREEKYNQIKELKMNISAENLCKGIPIEFSTFIKHCRNLKFEEKPDYSFLKKIFYERMNKEGIQFDYVYDWILIPLQNKNIIIPKTPINFEIQQNEEYFAQDTEENSNSSKDYGEDKNDEQDDNFYNQQLLFKQQLIMQQQQKQQQQQQQLQQQQYQQQLQQQQKQDDNSQQIQNDKINQNQNIMNIKQNKKEQIINYIQNQQIQKQNKQCDVF
ncbi:protein kinase domain protein [Ichthyophthirius multifiliis]|uniref:Casein kinase I n=1 Tax=Ichthyophthirius multifiliis TaxID=5932 RepID=G0QWZ7_ICHMU|nr:protein kinase domain protein [Ichthyophthirius multifiliis]EGR30261.1 protein kinase domain protein [Ichthyophthirius multifiliis]|eukprot:XP_004031857.1 protein kinase domain protein [Ichthyophthirius multifiliis]